ncbi:hypothetical protein PUR71_19610 [Streptomyces sp. SP17BM10]|uniref:hypothetical protein n=1 Tax=Streptomyces sp. SP17BM10 TaxID=3002530 RepID=UPI002E78B903|nr:hypothetical protein [Streptomyces sp. SP17BM10]MEE1785097.1 hypothetical protein [Streptomyces sp. SP17BM10]
MRTERRYEHAPAGTLPGLLQRGRGLGALMAAEDPSAAAELVYGCVRWEWRWDTAVDQRLVYLARLVRDLALPFGPVAERSEAGARARADEVLELLAHGHVRRDGAGEHGEHGQGADPRPLPVLLEELERCWVERTWCGPAALARGLAGYGPEAAGAASLLRRFWLWTPHSHERPAYLEALAAVAPAGLDEAYVESLWDCESGARLSAIRHAPQRPEVRARLVRLRDDPLEETAVRDAAAVRLGGGGAG